MSKLFKVGCYYSEEDRKKKMEKLGYNEYEVSVTPDWKTRYVNPENGFDYLVFETTTEIIVSGYLSTEIEANEMRKIHKQQGN